MCYKHQRVWEALALPLQCTRAARRHVPGMPCDIIDFLDMWPDIRHHPLLAIIAAMLKEPTATARWRQSSGFSSCRNAELGSQELFASLQEVAQAMGGCPNKLEVDQLSRGGSRLSSLGF